MSRSYRKQPVWKDHNRDMKKFANRKVRRSLKRNPKLALPNGRYKRLFCSYDICDYCSLVPASFDEYYHQEIERWEFHKNSFWYYANEPRPTRQQLYKRWLKYRRK